MARRRKGRDEGHSAGETSEAAQHSQTIASALASSPQPDHESSVLGVSNTTRYFSADDPRNGPAVVFRETIPFTSFVYGFSASDINAGDETAAVDITVSDPDQELYAINRVPISFEFDVWPIITQLFNSGTGYRTTVSFSAFVRYQAMVLRAYTFLYTVIIINQLTFHYRWRAVVPFTDVVPSFLYDLAKQLDATDVGLAERWLPLMKRLETKIVFPRMVSEIKRMLTPMFSVDLNGRLCVPIPFDVSTTEADGIEGIVIGLLDYVEVTMAEQGAVMNSFLPFPLMDMNPWGYVPEPAIDIDRDCGQHNSPTKYFKSFGDTGDPSVMEALVFKQEESDQVVYFSRHEQPVWGGVRLASIWEEYPGALDDSYALLTHHRHGQAWILGDDGSKLVYDGSGYDNDTEKERYEDFVNTRFYQRGLKWGELSPGYVGADFGHNAIVRMIRLDTQSIFNSEVLKVIMATMAGASLRELRYTIRAQVVESIASGR